jgi:hypothetical protein
VRDRIMNAVAEDLAAERPPLRALDGGAPARPRSRFPLPQTLLAAVAVAAIIALGIWNAQLQQNLHTEQQRAAFGSAVAQAIAAGATVHPVLGTTKAPSARAALLERGPNKQAYFVVQGLPASPSSRVYQLWLLRGATPYSAGVFTYAGGAPRTIPVTLPVKGYSAAAVTVEPGPHGSRKPTGAMVLLGKLG